MPLNAFEIEYRFGPNNNKWPDGTPTTNKNVEIPMRWKLKYLDNPNKPNSYPVDDSLLTEKEFISNIGK